MSDFKYLVNGLPPVVKRLGWVSLFTDAASDMIYPLLPAFLRSLGAGGQWLGIMEGVAEAVGSLVKWRAGALSDRGGRKRFVLLGYGVSTFVRPLLAFAMSPWQVVLIRATDRVGKGVRSAPRDALLAGAVEPERRAMAYGFHRMMDNLGAVIGPLMAFSLARFFDATPRTIFAFALLPGIVALLTIVFGVREPAPPAVLPETREEGKQAAPLPSSVKVYLVAVGIFSLGASADSFLLLRLSKQGLGDAWLPIAWLTLNLAKSATNIPGGRISDRIGHRRTLLVAWSLYAAVYALMPFATSYALTWALMLVYAAYYGLSEGGEKALVAELAPAESRGRAFGALHAVTGLAVLPANAVFGALFDASPRYAFWTSAACAAVGAGVLAVTARRGTTAGRAA
ncbi:MAG TPA: MFS transporter [Polyangiaceae bacterium]